MFTDRIFLPTDVVGQAMLGGCTVRNRIFPAYAVSYENLGGDFAGLVLEQGADRLTLLLVNLADRPRDGAFRVWQLDHGHYALRIGPDADDDGRMEAVEREETLELARLDRVPIRLPPRRPTLVTLRQVARLDDLYARADPAIGPDDLVRTNGALAVTVHNLGAAAASNLVVAALDREGREQDRAVIPVLPAPLDRRPKTAIVRLPATGIASIVLDPDRAVPDLTRDNNRASIPEAP